MTRKGGTRWGGGGGYWPGPQGTGKVGKVGWVTAGCNQERATRGTPEMCAWQEAISWVRSRESDKVLWQVWGGRGRNRASNLGGNNLSTCQNPFPIKGGLATARLAWWMVCTDCKGWGSGLESILERVLASGPRGQTPEKVAATCHWFSVD